MKIKKGIKFWITAILFILTLFFFVYEFKNHIDEFKTFKINLKIGYLLFSFSLLFLAYIISTYSYKYFIDFHLKKKIPFIEVLAVFNISRLANYIPGVVWGYGIQMYWFSKQGFSKLLPIYASIIILITNILASLYFFAVYFALNFNFFEYELPTLLIIVTIFIFIFAVFFNFFSVYIFKLINRVLKKEIVALHTPSKLILSLTVQYVFNYLINSIGCYYLLLGLGLLIKDEFILNFISIMSISDLMGLIVFFAPGGLGVKEGVMFYGLKDISINIALVFPIALRLVIMLITALLSLLGYLILKIKNKSIFDHTN